MRPFAPQGAGLLNAAVRGNVICTGHNGHCQTPPNLIKNYDLMHRNERPGEKLLAMTFSNIFTAVDVGALVLVLWEFLWGLKRGLSGELARLISTLITLVAGLRFYPALGRLLADNTRLAENRELAQAVAFLLIVVCFALLFLTLRLVLRLLMVVKFNEKIDRSGGGLAGLLRGALMVILCVYAIGLWPHEYLRDVVRKQSAVGQAVFRHAPWAIEKLNAIRWLDVGAKPPLPSPLPPLPELPIEETE